MSEPPSQDEVTAKPEQTKDSNEEITKDAPTIQDKCDDCQNDLQTSDRNQSNCYSAYCQSCK